MKTTYCATLFHPDGDSVTDFHHRGSPAEVLADIDDMGSRWVFYPLWFVTTENPYVDRRAVVKAPAGLEFLKGRRVGTVRRYLRASWRLDAEAVCKAINEGWPLGAVYPAVLDRRFLATGAFPGGRASF